MNHLGVYLILLLVICWYATFHYKWDREDNIFIRIFTVPIVALFYWFVFEAFYWVIKFCFLSN
jgi:hypothetical protein